MCRLRCTTESTTSDDLGGALGDAANLPDELVLTNYLTVADGRITSLVIVHNQPSLPTDRRSGGVADPAAHLQAPPRVGDEPAAVHGRNVIMSTLVTAELFAQLTRPLVIRYYDEIYQGRGVAAR